MIRALSIWILGMAAVAGTAEQRPSILLCLSDDQSYAHTGANGDPIVQTPAFDRVAREGLRFVHAFCDAPSCGPSRSALLTGQAIWRLEEGGNIHSTLPAQFATYPELLRRAGYAVGSTGKAWGPGRLEPGGRTINPAGAVISGRRKKPAAAHVSAVDYAENFRDFLREVPSDRPFCFWLGTYEPHRPFARGQGRKEGKDPARVTVPPHLPDHEIVRDDLLDYLTEIERFDRTVSRALEILEETGRLADTIVVVTSDHGMPFPRAKASLYDFGTRVPLAIRWPEGIRRPGRESRAFVNLSDLAPTFLEAAGLAAPPEMTARSLLNLFQDETDEERTAAFIAMERHDGCRHEGKGYPCRAMRTEDYLYIYNFEPHRWPAGSPDASVCARAIPFGEIDPSPTKDYLLRHRGVHGIGRLAELSFGMRPVEELYRLDEDPGQLNNVAGLTRYRDTQRALRERLFDRLRQTGDPRVTGGPVLWDHYPYYGARKNPAWKVASPDR